MRMLFWKTEIGLMYVLGHTSICRAGKVSKTKVVRGHGQMHLFVKF